MSYLVEDRLFSEHKDLPWFRDLLQSNIRHKEQLFGLLATGKGKFALEQIGVPPKMLQQFLHSVQRMTSGPSSKVSMSFTEPQRHFALGYKLKEGKYPSYGDPIDKLKSANNVGTALGSGGTAIPPDHNIFDSINPGYFPDVRDQGHRGTCVAFSLVDLLQIEKMRVQSDIQHQFSPQFLYYLAKKTDTNRIAEGINFDAALDVLLTYGVCLEDDWRYNPFQDFAQEFLFRNHAVPLKTLKAKATTNKIKGAVAVPRNNPVGTIKTCLLQNKPISIGVEVYQNAWYNLYTVERGEVAMPIVKDDEQSCIILDDFSGGHAITIVGYQDNIPGKPLSDRPGGGYFIFKNSWGQEWAPGGPTDTDDKGPGYEHIPYAYVENYFVDGCYIEI
jgi:Papain family cysteine protease